MTENNAQIVKAIQAAWWIGRDSTKTLPLYTSSRSDLFAACQLQTDYLAHMLDETGPGRTLTLTLSAAEASEVLHALRLRRHQKRTPYPGMCEVVWRRLYELACAASGVAPEPGKTCWDNEIRVSVQTRERW